MLQYLHDSKCSSCFFFGNGETLTILQIQNIVFKIRHTNWYRLTTIRWATQTILSALPTEGIGPQSLSSNLGLLGSQPSLWCGKRKCRSLHSINPSITIDKQEFKEDDKVSPSNSDLHEIHNDGNELNIGHATSLTS